MSTHALVGIPQQGKHTLNRIHICARFINILDPYEVKHDQRESQEDSPNNKNGQDVNVQNKKWY